MSNTQPDIIKDFPRVSAEVVNQAALYQPAIFADVAGRRGVMHGRVRALRPNMTIAGTAFTVEVRPGDNLMIHAALSLAKPGDVLVVDGKGDETCALMGAIMMNAAKKLGLAGVVLDAACRGMQVVAVCGVVGGRVGHPISCGGVTVCAGDFICADADGVVVVEREKIESLLPLAAHKVTAEAKRIAQIQQGDTAAPWLTASLVTAGVLNEGETL